MKRSTVASARFKPYCASVQTRHKWRHRESSQWRRLCDASCFVVNSISKPMTKDFTLQSRMHTHVLTCGHVLMPWLYPNYYPPVGATKYVSHIGMRDTMAQIRLSTAEGEIYWKHFLSQFHHYHHNNKRLDIACSHVEMGFRKFGEQKMMNLTNEGLLSRPRLEIIRRLRHGDHVWIYGMKAQEFYDDEKKVDPLMVPTAIKGVVAQITDEVFFVDTSIDEMGGQVDMGMCGGPVMRDGKVVGMLTAMVHKDSPTKEVAGMSMCTFSQDIWKLLVDIEKQERNPHPHDTHPDPSMFVKRRKAEGKLDPHYDYDNDASRIAIHVPVPVSSLRRENEVHSKWDDEMIQRTFGRGGPFDQEAQENYGFDMRTSREDGPPEGFYTPVDELGGRQEGPGFRLDRSPRNTHISDDFARDDPDSDIYKVLPYMDAGKSHGGASNNEMRMSADYIEAVRLMQQKRAADNHKQSAVNEAFSMGSMKTEEENPWGIRSDGSVDFDNLWRVERGENLKDQGMDRDDDHLRQMREKGGRAKRNPPQRPTRVRDILDSWGGEPQR